MSNMIDNIGNSTPFDMGDITTPAQNGMQTDASFGSVRMFSPDGSGDSGNAQPNSAPASRHARHAAANDDSAGTQGAGSKAQGGGIDASNAMSQILDIVKTALSAAMQLASPLLGMVTSLVGKAGSSGTGAA